MEDFDFRSDLSREKNRMRDEYPRKKKKKKKKKTAGQRVLGTLGRVLIVILTTLIIAFVFIFGVLMIMFHGPSESAKVLLTSSLNETSALKWVPGLFLSDEEVASILEGNTMKALDDGTISDTSLIHVDKEEEAGTKPIEVIDITGSTYRGKLIIVQDPSKVFLGTLDAYFQGNGKVVAEIAEDYNAKGYNIIAGINGGEFVDAGSYSYSAMPIGSVISEGDVKYDDSAHNEVIAGFTKDNVFVVGNMSTEEAVAMGIRDCVNTKTTTGPALVINGEAMTVPDASVYGGGKNPRTAIGQRADGAVLLLVIDGRQANSIGATFKELAYVMLDYGAVNAAAMDGGTSTQMWYNGEVINDPYSPTGPRKCPTCWLVKE